VLWEGDNTLTENFNCLSTPAGYNERIIDNPGGLAGVGYGLMYFAEELIGTLHFRRNHNAN
jgi:hypothetical protein